MKIKPRYQKGQLVWGYQLDTIALSITGGAVHKYQITSEGYQGHDDVLYKAKRIANGKTAARAGEVYEHVLFDNELDAHLELQRALLFYQKDLILQLKKLSDQLDDLAGDVSLIRQGVTRVS